MAKMYPVDIQNYNYVYSEYKFYCLLKEQLSDKYHVFYSIRWFETSEHKRVDSECDFLIFDPSFGFLTIEVKGGQRIDIIHNSWSLTEIDQDGNKTTRELKSSPFYQAEKSMRHFYDYFRNEFLQSFNGVYGFAVAFPMFQVDQKIEAAAEKELILDVRDMNSLAKRINEIFHYWKNKRNHIIPFSNNQKNRFINMINKQISLSAAAGALIPMKEKELNKINIVQDSIIDFLMNYKQVQIVGGAGTGKTFMAMKKMIRELYQERKVIYLCKSKELAAFVKKQIPDNMNLICSDLYTYISKMTGIQVPSDNQIFDLAETYKYDLFDAVIVDEGQDFTVNEALLVRALLKNQGNSVLYVFHDENQNLLNNNFNSNFAINTNPYILRYNIRNTGEIYKYAVETTNLGKETVANNLLGVIPEVRQCKNRVQALTTVSQIVNRLIQKEFVDTSSIVILSDISFEKSSLSGESHVGSYPICICSSRYKKGDILFQTVNQYKGLEADIVIYISHLEKNKIDERVKRRENYVGFTRARYYLYVIEVK